MSTKKSTTKVSKKSKLDPKKDGRIAYMAGEMVTAPVGAQPPILGSRTRIWKQDPSVDIAVRDVYVLRCAPAGCGLEQS